MTESESIPANLDRGESVVMEMGDDVLVVERRPKSSNWEVGDVVTDRESDGDDLMLVVHPSTDTIENTIVGGINIGNANKNYPSDDTSVYCVYLENLLGSIGGIPEDLGMFFKDGKFRVLNVKAYAYPSTRLEDASEEYEDVD
jgi:hypothetical protein